MTRQMRSADCRSTSFAVRRGFITGVAVLCLARPQVPVGAGHGSVRDLSEEAASCNSLSRPDKAQRAVPALHCAALTMLTPRLPSVCAWLSEYVSGHHGRSESDQASLGRSNPSHPLKRVLVKEVLFAHRYTSLHPE